MRGKEENILHDPPPSETKLKVTSTEFSCVKIKVVGGALSTPNV
jgi:hypothetical protein